MRTLLATIPSLSGGEDHQIFQEDTGDLTCSCKAGQHGVRCWAMKKIEGQLWRKEFNDKLKKTEDLSPKQLTE